MGVKKYSKKGQSFWRVDTWLEFPDGRKQRLKRGSIPTREMAVALEHKMQVEAYAGKHFDVVKPKSMTVSDAWASYKPVAVSENRSSKTDEGRAKHLLAILGGRRAEGLTMKDVHEYRARRAKQINIHGRQPAVSTVNREVAMLRHLLNHAVQCGDLDRNPLVGVPMLAENNVRDVMVSEVEFTLLLQVADPQLQPILVLAYDTGMRKREILDLRWDQVNLRDGVIRLSAKDTKAKAPRIIVLTRRALQALQSTPRSLSGFVFVNPETAKPWNHIQKKFHRARTAAGLERIWFHDLRRSFVTNARRRDVPESVVMRMSGHKTRSVFDRYNVVSEDDLRKAVLRIEAGCERELAQAAESR
jgi:integrase